MLNAISFFNAEAIVSAKTLKYLLKRHLNLDKQMSDCLHVYKKEHKR